jgi:hypothetical protein
MNCGLHVELVATVGPSSAAGLDTLLACLMDELHGTSDRADHLDVSVGAATAPDGLTADVEVDMTVSAGTLEDAFGVGMTWLRTAAHAAGASTPGWENAAPGDGIIVFGVPSVSLGPVLELTDTRG